MRAILCVLILTATASISSATIIMTFEAAGATSTTKANTITETFNAAGLTAGTALGTYVSPIGTYSTGAEIVAADAFGTSKYVSVGAQSGTTSYSLTFNSVQSYFGMYWAAGDAQNRLEFYKNNVLIQTFQLSDFFGLLSSAYLGNPGPANLGADGDQKFVYINFTSNAAGTNFDKLIFRNLDTSTGFETDNHSILAGVPEPSSLGMMFAGLGTILAVFRRRRSVVVNT